INETCIRTLAPALDTDRFKPGPHDDALLRSHGVRESRRLLYLGRLSAEKNLPLLVEIFQRLCRRRGDTALLIAGQGPYLATMQRELAKLPAHFVGRLHDEPLPHIFRSCDLFAFPSRTDTLGQAVMEAQACGLPAMVSGEGGPREIVLDGMTGLVLHTMDAEK